jgi:4-hydroxyphenylpyruvate dioxygenase
MKSSLFDVVDPDGIIKSQVISTGNRTLQIALNGSDGPDISANKFIKSVRGAAVQHLAFATTDIFALSKRLQEQDFGILPQTRNYYDDVLARFDPDPALLAKMQAGNILYDEDEDG